jgi:hypothetical protein
MPPRSFAIYIFTARLRLFTASPEFVVVPKLLDVSLERAVVLEQFRTDAFRTVIREEKAGYRGHTEVEIFSATDWWTRPGDDVLRTCIERFNSAS